MTEIFVENLITNGDVAKNADGWEAVTGTLTRLTFSDGTAALKLSATEADQDISFKSTETIPLIKSHKYYISFRVAQFGDATKVIRTFWPEDSALPLGTATTPKAGTWYRAANVASVSHNSSGMYSIKFEVQSVDSAQFVYFDQMMLIDLTEAFGAGNEPTVTWCNENIEYFEGKRSLSMWFTTALILDAFVEPTEVVVGAQIKLTAKVQSEKKIYEVETFYVGEPYTGEA